MKLRRIARFHGLKKPRVRQTWNKYNLFNLARLREPGFIHQTFFQQKWASKALTRGYHGEHVKERVWEHMFSRRLPSAVDVNPAYLAANDGSELASGRGSGRQTRPLPPSEEQQQEQQGQQRSEGGGGRGGGRAPRGPEKPRATPYMQMTFAPLERRLDQAIFRALFASSARQARQFCVHGAVKVNGVKMKYPGYLLNPGDMFQVDVDKVLFATGRKKVPTVKLSKALAPPPAAEEAAEEGEGDAEAGEAAAPAGQDKAAKSNLSEEAAQKQRIKELRQIRERAKQIIGTPTGVGAKRKKALRALMKDVKLAWARLAQNPTNATNKNAGDDDLVNQLSSMLSELELSPAEKAAAATEAEAVKETQETEASKGALVTKEERDIFRRLVREEMENPVDPTKPYATPWQPRPYMSAFAFIPRYLEVNQNICAAVYLRHPVARQGNAEVPTPFSSRVSQMAFTWYLRRG